MKLDYLILIAIALMVLMAMSVVMFVILHQRRVIRHQLELNELESKKQIELFQAAAQSEEEERQRIAAELHDDIGATLSSVRLFLHQAEKIGSADLVRQSGQLVDESIRKVRDISHKLQPSTLQTLGLQGALQTLADVYKRSDSVKFDVLPGIGLQRLEAHKELHVYRIVQELINNILKHSGASFIVLQLSIKNNELVVTLQHDGAGLSNEGFQAHIGSTRGIGLKNISSRLQFIKGKIEFKDQTTSFITEMSIPTA